MFFVCLKDPKTAVFVDECVLEVATFLSGFTNQTRLWNKFDINLAPLSWILHLFVRFGFLFRVGQFYRFTVQPAQNTVQTGDGSGIASLAQLDPEHHQTGVRVPAAHVLDELDLGICMLVRVVVRAVRAICKGTNCSVVLLTPAVDVLPGGFVADCSLCDAVLKRILNYYLLKPHVLCYLIHSE